MRVNADSRSLNVPLERIRCKNVASEEEFVSLFPELADSYSESSDACRLAALDWREVWEEDDGPFTSEEANRGTERYH